MQMTPNKPPKLPRSTGRIGYCGVCGCRVMLPCLACFVREHAQPRRRPYRDLTSDEELRYDLSPDQERRLRELRTAKVLCD